MPDEIKENSHPTTIGADKPDDRILVELTSDFPNMFQNVQKFAGYINHLMSIQTHSLFFVEIIQNGFIYIYNDFELFSLLNPIMRKAELEKIIAENFPNAGFFLGGVFTNQSYPIGGLTIKYKVYAADPGPALEILFRFFASFHCSSIVSSKVDGSTLIVNFTSFRSLQMYADHLGALLHQMLPDSHFVQ
jgi:hypothetical protein